MALSPDGRTLAYVGVSLACKTSLHDRLHAARFLGHEAQTTGLSVAEPNSAATVADLRELLACFVGTSHARNLIERYGANDPKARLSPHERADPKLVRLVEHGLAGALGASTVGASPGAASSGGIGGGRASASCGSG